MSGKQAKVKKKGAKKTMVKTPVSVPNNMRLTEFFVRNVRCFAGENRVPIRPITLLVGENSTGKTTFLGCYQRFIDMLSMSPVPIPDGEFSRPPFFMGGFPDIARRVGSGRSKPREFSIGGVISGVVGMQSPVVVSGSFESNNEEAQMSRMILVFSDNEVFAVSKPKVIKPKAMEVSGKYSDSTDSSELKVSYITGPGFDCKIALPPFLGESMDYNSVCLMVGLFGPIRERLAKKDGKLADAFAGSAEDNANLQKFLRRNFHISKKDDSSAVILQMRSLFSGLGDCTAVAPIRPMPQRSYDPIVNGNIEDRFLVKLSRMARVTPEKWKAFRKLFMEFGVKSGMFSQLEVEAHGKGVDAPFSLRVNARGVNANIADVGYGVSQLLPFLGRIVEASLDMKNKHFLFQQPEDHLHPRAQAEFASLIANAAKKDGHTFLVETHSDFIVDRICMHVAEGDIASDDVALLFFEPQKSGGKVKIRHIELNSNGEPISTPKGYRDFFLHETERALGLRKG